MTAEALLDRLDGVHQVGRGRWRARCPAHDGKNREVLSIGETTDGTVLVKCFHGCSAADVVAAVGLKLGDLFPRVDWQETGTHHARPRRPRADWPALFAAVERDLILVKIMLSMIAERKLINDADADAAAAAAGRVYALIQEARHEIDDAKAAAARAEAGAAAARALARTPVHEEAGND
jgi:hypothetical protein